MIKVPAPTRITKDQAQKIVKTAAYIAASAVISYLITLVTNDPELFGPLTPIINLLLVSVKQVFSKE